MVPCLFRWGREKYSEGREVESRVRESGAEGEGSGDKGRKAGVGDPLSTPHYNITSIFKVKFWSRFGLPTGRGKVHL